MTQPVDFDAHPYLAGPYGLANYDAAPKWAAVKAHPLFRQMVQSHVAAYDEQIHRLRTGDPKVSHSIRHTGGVAFGPDHSTQIAKDVGYGDPTDVWLAVTRHPAVRARDQERDAERESYLERRKKVMKK